MSEPEVLEIQRVSVESIAEFLAAVRSKGVRGVTRRVLEDIAACIKRGNLFAGLYRMNGGELERLGDGELRGLKPDLSARIVLPHPREVLRTLRLVAVATLRGIEKGVMIEYPDGDDVKRAKVYSAYGRRYILEDAKK